MCNLFIILVYIWHIFLTILVITLVRGYSAHRAPRSEAKGQAYPLEREAREEGRRSKGPLRSTSDEKVRAHEVRPKAVGYAD